MESFLSIANSFVKKVFQTDPFAVNEVRTNNYVHFDILARDDFKSLLIVHTYINEQNQAIYEIVLHNENKPDYAFSIYRSQNQEECHLYFLRLKDKLPVLVHKLSNLLSVSVLQQTCRYINDNPSQNLGHICAHFGHVDYFRQLSPSSPAQPSELEMLNICDDNGKTPVHIAVESQRLSVIQAILSLSPKLDIVDNDGNNILHLAAQTNQQIIAAICTAVNTRTIEILTGGDQPESRDDLLNNSSSTLFQMINTKNKNNFTPLYLACVKDKPECVKELLKNGADVNGASICDQNSIVRDESFDLSDLRLIKQLNPKDMKNGGTPLHWCKSVEVVEMLIEMNCNLNARNFHGDTALHIMVTRANINCVLSLLSHGADVSAIGANGNTPLHLAVKANDTSLVQALVVFGANVDFVNSSGETARHLAATSSQSPSKDVILYVLNSVCAKRCQIKKTSCTQGCAPDHLYNGVPPENSCSIRINSIFDQVLMKTIVKEAVQKKFDYKASTSDSNKKIQTRRVKLLCLDGGGIRGLVLIQLLSYLENYTKKNIADIFDWIAGTSTGGILALLLSRGYKADECRQIYFRLKDKIFVGYRPYCSETLEKFLQTYLGKETKMSGITNPRVMITATVANNFPPDATFFRNYEYPKDLITGEHRNDVEFRNVDEYLWKVARATGAAPTYFSQFESYLDGGLVSNNPTLDLLTEIQEINQSNIILDLPERYEVELLVSMGTGAIPTRPLEKLNFSLLQPFTGITSFASNIGNLFRVLIEQASQSNGQVVERAQAWCSSIKVPFFRVNPPISEDIQMDESDNVKLVNMLWETMAYIHMRQDDFNALFQLLLNDE